MRAVLRGPGPVPPIWVGEGDRPPRFGGLDYGAIAEKLATARAVTVLVPVYGGAEEVRECVSSLLRWTPREVRILLLDDASPDEPTTRVLKQLAENDRVEVRRRPINLGYTGNVNAGLFDARDDDVVLLNSDTVVGPLWLQRLRWVAYSENQIAAVSPLSDNAGAMAVPQPGRYNDWATRWGWNNAARGQGQIASQFSVNAPTAHGFCMYMRREAIDDVGIFDIESFPRGYGEENDWSMRARSRGWSVKLAPHVLIRHRQGRSFGDQRAVLIAAAQEVLARLHPTYRAEVQAWMAGRPMAKVHSDSRRAVVAVKVERYRPRLLSVLHIAGGGTPQTNRELLASLALEQDTFVVQASPSLVRLHAVTPRGWTEIDVWRPRPVFQLRDDWRPDYAAWLARWMIDLGIETVHVRHLINQPLGTLPQMAARLGIPLVFSTHDFYMVCPTVNLVDGEGKYCGGKCTPGLSRCQLPTAFVAQAQDLKRGGVQQWRLRSLEAMSSAQAVIATSEDAADVHRRTMPEIADRVVVIEHGRPFSSRPAPPWREAGSRHPGPLRIFCAANWNAQKGMSLVGELVDLTGPLVEWHLAGPKSEQISPNAIAHGPYTDATLTELVENIDPDIVGIFSIWAETYSQTLSESWGMGLPVIATDLGAVGERIRAHGGGLLVDHTDPQSIADQLQVLARRVLRGEPLGVSQPGPKAVRSIEEMAADYRALYRNVSSQIQIGVVTSDGDGAPYVRLRSRFSRLMDDQQVNVREYSVAELQEGVDRFPLDTLVVQRDALLDVSPHDVLAPLKDRGVRLVAELDDDLVAAAAEGRITTERGAAVEHLLNMADAVVVSTPALARSLALPNDVAVTVSQNLVDESVWGSASAAIEHTNGKSRRWVYWGTASHDQDLLLLREAFEQANRDELVHELDVIGVTESEAEWYNRIPIPSGFRPYPKFAAWLQGLARERQWYGGLAPLVDSPFVESKSDLKVLEYAMLGLPVLAADAEPYRGLSRYGVTLVSPTPEAWHTAILAAGARPSWRAEGQAVVEYARSGRTLENTVALDEWLAAVVGYPVRAR